MWQHPNRTTYIRNRQNIVQPTPCLFLPAHYTLLLQRNMWMMFMFFVYTNYYYDSKHSPRQICAPPITEPPSKRPPLSFQMSKRSNSPSARAGSNGETRCCSRSSCHLICPTTTSAHHSWFWSSGCGRGGRRILCYAWMRRARLSVWKYNW